MKLSIIGNGAIGNLLAFRCQQLAYNYQVIARTAQPVTLTVKDSNGNEFTFPLPLQSLSSVAHSDIILLPIKAYQVAEFIQQAQQFIRPQQTIVLLHNGMGTIELVQQHLPQLNIVAATTSYGAYKPSSTALEIKGQGQSHFGWLQQFSDTHSDIDSYLSALLPPSTWHQNIRLALWKKLTINAAINPITALHNIRNGDLALPQYQVRIKTLCDEISPIMQKLGFMLKADELLDTVNLVIQQTSENYSSMNRDIHAKRPTEIDFINGYIVKQAQRFNLPCPLNLQLLNDIKLLERQY